MKKLFFLILFVSFSASAEYPQIASIEYSNTVIEYEDKKPIPPPPLPKYEIIIDRNEYTMDIYVDDVFVETRRVIVGRQGRSTPTFETTFDQIEVNPTWDVPRSLEDDMVLKFRGKKNALGYINRNGYYFVDKETGAEIPATDIDWHSIDPYNTSFKIKQRPGNLNMLGRVMFVLEDQGGVQMHGTANPELFEREVRRFSSGCIRVDDANGLAGLLLDEPDFLAFADQIGNRWIRLPAPVTIKVID